MAARPLHQLGYGATDEHYYFAYAVNEERDVSAHGPLRYELARVNLRNVEIDWQVTLELPRRARQLKIDSVRFSPDGTRLALAEYNDRAGERDHPARPPQQVYVVQVASRRVDTYPIPLSAYGAAFTPDSRYLLLGSHETGTILRIDVVDRRQTHSVQATSLWDLNFPGEGAANAPYAKDGLELRSDGSVLLKGIVRVSRGVERPWTGVVSAGGKLVSSQPPVAPP